MTTKRVEWSRAAQKDLRSLDDATRQRIRRAVHRLAETGHGDVRKLQGVENEWRLRVGDWRVRFTVTPSGGIVILLVLRVLPRGSAYQA